MDKCQTEFLRVLAEYANGKKSSAVSVTEEKDFLNYVQNHQVAGIFYKQTGMKCFKPSYIAQLCMGRNREILLQEIHEALQGEEYFVVKGIAVARYYPDPMLRSMGDIDLVIHEDRQEMIHLKLIDNGFKLVCHENMERVYKKYDMEIEVHSKLIYDEVFDTRQLKCFFNNCWMFYDGVQLDENFHFLYLFVHLRKHMFLEGAGFRQLMDIVFMMKNAEIDWKWIEDNARKVNLWAFIKKVLAFNERWFQIQSPVETSNIEEDFYETATEIIFKNGVFGFTNPDSEVNESVNLIVSSGDRAVMLKNLRKSLFLPYKTMVKMKEYGFLENRPYLLPVAWIYRFFIKIGHGKRVMNKYLVPDKILRSRQNFLEKWGL